MQLHGLGVVGEQERGSDRDDYQGPVNQALPGYGPFGECDVMK
jgi:hypothetical protein